MLRLGGITLGLILAFGVQIEDASAQRQGNANRNRGQAQQQGAQTQGQSQRQRPDAQQVAQQMMANFDADGNGALDIHELTSGLAALEEAMRQRRAERENANTQSGATTDGSSRRSQSSGQRGGRGRRSR